MNERTLPFQGLRVLMIMGVMCLHTYQYPVFGAGEELVSFFLFFPDFYIKTNYPGNRLCCISLNRYSHFIGYV